MPGIDPRLTMMISRGRITRAVYGSVRTMVQLVGLHLDAKKSVELLLPYGMSANPLGGDVLQLQNLASRDHVVALPGDYPAIRIAALAGGEFGFQDDLGQQIVWKRTGLVVKSTLGITIDGNVT